MSLYTTSSRTNYSFNIKKYKHRSSNCGSTVFIVKYEELPNMTFKIYISTVMHTSYFECCKAQNNFKGTK